MSTTTFRSRLAFGSLVGAASFIESGIRLLRKTSAWAAAIFLAVLIGCASAPAYKTLYAVGHATDAAVKTYFDLVVAGHVRTNDVPRISKMYDEFQSLYRAAEAIAEFSPSARAGTNITARAAALIGAAAAAKGSP